MLQCVRSVEVRGRNVHRSARVAGRSAALDLFARARELNLELPVHTHETVLTACRASGRWERALEILERMQGHKVPRAARERHGTSRKVASECWPGYPV